MPKNHRAPGTNVIYEFVPIFIIDFGTLSPLDKKGIPPYGFEGSDRTVHSPRKIVLGFIEKFIGAVSIH